MPDISVVIPIYNSENTLEECVFSVLAQSYSDYEIILVDDGSKDNSWEICKKLRDTDSRIRVVHKENKGVSHSRNMGIEMSKGKWITFVDSDDYLFPDMLRQMTNDICNDRSLACCSAQYSSGNSFFSFPDEIIDIEDRKNIGHILLFGGPVAKLYNKKLLLEKGIRFDERFSKHEDTLFFWEYMKYVDVIRTISYVGYVYRLQDTTVSLHNRVIHPDILCEISCLLDSKYTALKNRFYISSNHDTEISLWLSSFKVSCFLSCYKIKVSLNERKKYWNNLATLEVMEKRKIRPRILMMLLLLNNFQLADVIFHLLFHRVNQ